MADLSRRTLLRGAGAVGGAALLAPHVGAVPAAAAPAGPGPVVVVRGDPRHPGLSRGQNQRWVSDPDKVRLPRDTAEVVAAVQDAVDSGRRLGVRSGGHCYEDFVDNPETRIIVDMSMMAGIGYDPVRRSVMVSAGATLGDVYTVLFKTWGITLPGGSCHPVGVGGHVPGAGYGQLSRQHGVISDHLEAVEVVVVDAAGRARAVVAGRDQAGPLRDLWWAHTGGGGGSFGVATRFWFRTPGAAGSDPAGLLPRAPAESWIAALSWSWDGMTRSAFRTLLDNYGRWCERHAAPGSPYPELFARLEPAPRASGPIVLSAVLDSAVPDARRVLLDFFRQVNAGTGLTPSLEEMRELPWLHSTGWPRLWVSYPTDRYEYKSSYQRRRFSAAQLDGLWTGLTATDYAQPGFALSIATYGGRVNAVAPGATAYPHRDSAMKLLWGTAWQDPAEDDVHVGWHRRFYAGVHAETGGVPVPNRVTDGCFVNYADTDLSDPRWNRSAVPWHDLYFKDNYPRLRRVKARWDPRDVFRHAQSVRLP